MSGVSKGSLGLCGANNEILPTSLANDFLMYVTRSNQRMLFGTSNSKTCMIVNGTGDVSITNNMIASNIGINHSTPLGKIHAVQSQSNTRFAVFTGSNRTSNAEYYFDLSSYMNSSDTPTSRITVRDDNSYSSHIAVLTKTPGADANNLAERIRITSLGNMGIGTSNPFTKLDVNGSIATAGVVRLTDAGSLQNITISTGSNNSVDPLVLSTVVPLSKGGTGISTATGTTGQSNIVLSSNPTLVGTVNADIISVNSALGRFYGKSDTESAPSYTWDADSNTGMFNQSNNVIAFVLNGTQHFKMQPGLLSTSNADLSLHGDTRFITLETNNDTSSSSTAGITLKNNWKRERGIYFENIDSSYSNSIWHLGSKYSGGSANSNLGFYYSSNIIQEFGPTGNVGIGKAPTAYKLDVNGNIACNGITLFQASA